MRTGWRAVAWVLVLALWAGGTGCVSVHADLPAGVAAQEAAVSALLPGLDGTARADVQARIRDAAGFWARVKAQVDPGKDDPTTSLWWRFGKGDLRDDATLRADLVAAFVRKIDAGETTPALELELLRDHAAALTEWVALTD